MVVVAEPRPEIAMIGNGHGQNLKIPAILVIHDCSLYRGGVNHGWKSSGWQNCFFHPPAPGFWVLA